MSALLPYAKAARALADAFRYRAQLVRDRDGPEIISSLLIEIAEAYDAGAKTMAEQARNETTIRAQAAADMLAGRDPLARHTGKGKDDGQS